MAADGFAWWKSRFDQMKYYFDAFRIDHILGFFRIWSIPMHAVEGILGHFVPAIFVAKFGAYRDEVAPPASCRDSCIDCTGIDGQHLLSPPYTTGDQRAPRWVWSCLWTDCSRHHQTTP